MAKRPKSSKPPQSKAGKRSKAAPEKQTVPPRDRERSRLYYLGYWGAVAASWGVLAGAIFAVYLALDLPDVKRLPKAGSGVPSVIVRGVGGVVLVREGPTVGDRLAYSDIPDTLVHAFLAIEDRSFFVHKGIDPKGLARAVMINAAKGRVAAGGSTITQQLAKNLYLNRDRTLIRKAREAMLALWLEASYSKTQILAEYLNRVYFGGGAYGIDAAAQKYFGHSARTLTIPEAAMLAGLVKAPSRLAPHINPDGAWKRAKLVLGAMADIGILTDMAAKKLQGQPPRIRSRDHDINLRYATDFAIAEARRLVGTDAQTLIIDTTLDASIQAASSAAIVRGLGASGARQNVEQAAAVVMGFDGAIHALVGGRDYAKSTYNRAVQAKRQPGSAFKLFPYLAALESGVDPTDRYVDGPISVGDWAPKNYGGTFSGSMTVRDAFARSVNTIAVQLNEDTGRNRSVQLAKRLGIRTPLAPIPSLPLGTEEVRLLDLTAAYAAVGSGGFQADPYVIVEIRDRMGEILYRRPRPTLKPVLSHDIAEDMSAMLTQVITSGSGRRAALDRPAGGKSGTSQDNRDAVFVGFTADYAAGVWVGNDDGTPMRGTSGSGLPATIWHDLMIDSHAGHPVRPLLSDAGRMEQLRDISAPTRKRGLFSRLFGN